MFFRLNVFSTVFTYRVSASVNLLSTSVSTLKSREQALIRITHTCTYGLILSGLYAAELMRGGEAAFSIIQDMWVGLSCGSLQVTRHRWDETGRQGELIGRWHTDHFTNFTTIFYSIILYITNVYDRIHLYSLLYSSCFFLFLFDFKWQEVKMEKTGKQDELFFLWKQVRNQWNRNLSNEEGKKPDYCGDYKSNSSMNKSMFHIAHMWHTLLSDVLHVLATGSISLKHH